MLEIQKVRQDENNMEIITNFNKIPYSLINAEVEDSAKDTLDELIEIEKYYDIYKMGSKFTAEGTNGDYIASDLKYKTCKALVDKEARFLFSETPTISIENKGDVGKANQELLDALTTYNDLIKTILDKNMFDEKLIKASRDCFIGKRVACLVNFNIDTGVTVQFIPSTQFLYDTEMNNESVLVKFVSFIIVKESKRQTDRRIFKKKYTKDGDNVYLEESLFDGAGTLINQITKKQRILLKCIPAVVIKNDGLIGDQLGESEISNLNNFEAWYSKLSNGDIDAERKSMNPVKYTVDMEPGSTKSLSTAAGSYWDLASDQNLESPNPQVGELESSMSYSTSLNTTLKRLKTSQYEQVDMPNITLESLQGVITSGKSLKAIYWPLITRCKEKMKVWGPELKLVIEIIIEGSLVYPNCIKSYITDPLIPINYEIKIKANTPLPEDEIEKKTIDLSEVQANTMSKKAYMKKWRELTDDEVDEELKQIAYERQLLEDNFMPGFSSGGTSNLTNGTGTDDKSNPINDTNDEGTGGTNKDDTTNKNNPKLS